MKAHALYLEMPAEFITAEFTDEADSIPNVITELSKKYTFGMNLKPDVLLMSLIFEKENERDWAYNEITNICNVDAIRMNHPFFIPDEALDDKTQEKYRKKLAKEMEKQFRSERKKKR